MHDLNDDDLMQIYGEGDTDAFEVLFCRHQGSVYNFACMLLRDRSAAEEVVQETFLAVVQNAARYSGTGQFRPWLLRIARNRCLNRIEAARAIRALEGWETAEPAARQLSPPEAAEQTEQVSLLQAALLKLPERQREALVLHVFERMSYIEISHVLEVPINTVKTLIHRAKATLAQLVEDR